MEEKTTINRDYFIDHFNKKGKQLTPISDQSFYLYLDSIGADHKIASVTTDMNGKAKCFIPPSLKSIWDAKPLHTFMAAKDADAEEWHNPKRLRLCYISSA